MYRSLISCLVASAFLAVCGDASRAQDWSGSYAGLHAGIRWSNLDLSIPAYQFPVGAGGTLDVPAFVKRFHLRDGFVGGHGGYNYLVSRAWLVGLEGDMSFATGSRNFHNTFRSSRPETSTRTITTTRNVVTTETITEIVPCECDDDVDVEVTTTRTIVTPVTETRTITTERIIESEAVRRSNLRLGIQGTLRSRLGFVDGSWLYYVTGGIAFTEVDWDQTIAIAGGERESVSKNDRLVGFVVGGGVEKFIVSQWLLRLEYLYEDFGSIDVPLAFSTKKGELDVTVHKLRVGLSFKF